MISSIEANKKSEWSFFDEWWTWFSYNFKWSDSFTHFNPHVCNITASTYFFGGSRMRNYVMGKYTWSAIGTLKDKMGGWANTLEHDTVGYVQNTDRKTTAREKYLPLMIGRDYHEPCIWQDKAPKIIDWKISAPQDAQLSRGEFDMFIGRGKQDCGEGRFGKLGPRPESGTPAAKEWDDAFKEAQKISNLDKYQFGWQPDSNRNPPLASFNSGGWIGNPGDNLWSKGSYYTSALFTPSVVDQTICLIFYCKNQYAACSVAVEHFIVSDIAGMADELPNGTVFWNMTPMDLFALFMTIFSLIFFCVQCCCCCQIFSLELKGGVIDQQAILEENIMKEAEKNRNQLQQQAAGSTRSQRGKRERRK